MLPQIMFLVHQKGFKKDAKLAQGRPAQEAAATQMQASPDSYMVEQLKAKTGKVCSACQSS